MQTNNETGQEVLPGQKVIPCVSIVIPVQKKYPHYKETEAKVWSLVKTAEKKLTDNYTAETAAELIKKLNDAVSKIQFDHLKEALAIYVSPAQHKIIHLPFAAEEKLVVDYSFEVRDLLQAATSTKNYLVISLSHHYSKAYRVFNNTIIENGIGKIPQGVALKGKDHPTRIGNFSDPGEMHESDFENFLHQFDHSLGEHINTLNIPVIICAPEKIAGHFKAITKNTKHIAGYVHGNFDHATKNEIYAAIEPVLQKESAKEQNEILQQLENASNNKNCVAGIREVWKAALDKRGRILVVEKSYSCSGKKTPEPEKIFIGDFDEHHPDFVKDVVDDIIEMVLDSNGKVVFTGNGALKDFDRIALITYF